MKFLETFIRLSLNLSLVIAAGWVCSCTTYPPEPAMVSAPEMKHPMHNPYDPDVVKLGEKLFFDPFLSADHSISCASCHKPELAFSDGLKHSIGVFGREGTRNAPSLINIGYQNRFFWDAGAMSLEQQVFGPLEEPNEMDRHLGTLIADLKNHAYYNNAFKDVFGEEVSPATLAKALASYQRSLVGFTSDYDDYLEGEMNALSEAAKRGLQLFQQKAACISCHQPPLFSDFSLRHNGLYDTTDADNGRGRLTMKKEDDGKFKVQPLRNVALTAPYMHDGRFSTLEEVMDHYNKGGNMHPNQDDAIRQLNLNKNEIEDLIAFLKALTDKKEYVIKSMQ